MTKMLGLVDKVITRNSRKRWGPSTEMKCEKGEKMKILELKNKVPEVKNSQNGFNRKMNSTEKGLVNLKTD